MADQVHLVIGRCGVWELEEWVVCGYMDEEQAKAHAAAATKAAAALREKWCEDYEEDYEQSKNPYDLGNTAGAGAEVTYVTWKTDLRERFTP